MPCAALLVLKALERMDKAPCLTLDRNGRGSPYVTMRYRRDGRIRHLCLSGLDADSVSFLRAAVALRWPSGSRKLAAAIRTLRERIRRNMAESRALAQRCGCRFHGTLLRRTGGNP
jgi:hypothetical protein